LITVTLVQAKDLSNTPTQADACVGFWLSEQQDGVIKIVKNSQGKYEGRIVWIRDLHLGKVQKILDVKNQDESRHDKPVLNMINLRDFVFDKDKKQWVDGTVYDPNNGKTYSAYLKMKEGKLHLRGYVGIALFGRTNIWTRERGAIPEMYQKKIAPIRE
jgi:uncharacterized protein (DUF2147 family)